MRKLKTNALKIMGYVILILGVICSAYILISFDYGEYYYLKAAEQYTEETTESIEYTLAKLEVSTNLVYGFGLLFSSVVSSVVIITLGNILKTLKNLKNH